MRAICPKNTRFPDLVLLRAHALFPKQLISTASLARLGRRTFFFRDIVPNSDAEVPLLLDFFYPQPRRLRGTGIGSLVAHIAAMPGSSGDDNDSRTAAFTQQRNRANGSSNHSSRNSSQRPSKRQRRARRDTDGSEVNDFVPRGATFSANSLEVDPDSTSSSGSDSEQDANKQSQPNPYAGTTAQAVNWNQGNRRAIRTTLGGRKGAGNNNQKKPEKPEENKSNTQFEAVNGAYWRSHSASASSGDGHGDQKGDEGNDTEEGELHESETTGVPPMDTSGDSDDSESSDSKADESIMLNIGSRPGEKANGQVAMDEDDDYDPESHQVLDISFDSGPQNGDTVRPTKEGAIRNFTLKYPTAPTVMLDLVGEDKNIQSRFWYWKRIEDFQAPVSCTECLQEGHIAQVCPSKEVCSFESFIIVWREGF